MTTKTWVGTDGDWNTAGNWSPTGVPEDDDDIFFVSGSQDVDGLTPTENAFGRITVGSQYTGDIGSDGDALTVDCDDFDFGQKNGQTFIDGTIGTATIQNTSSLNPAVDFQTSTITTLRILGGRGAIVLQSGSEVETAIQMIGCSSAILDCEDGVDLSGADITIDSGRMTIRNSPSSITQFGGTIYYIEDTVVTVGTFTMYGGKCNWKPTGLSTLSNLVMYGGYFNMKDSIAPQHKITNSTIYSGATLDERSGLANVLYVNPISMDGGVVLIDTGRSVTIT